MSAQQRGRVWVRVTVTCPPEAADAIIAALIPVSPNGVVINEQEASTEVTGYMGPYISPEATADVTRRVRALASVPDTLLGGCANIEAEVVPEEDWIEAFRAHHKPARIGRIVIKPTWERWPSPHLSPRPDDILIEIDPGLAFGTGQHPTTRICLHELQEHMSRGARVLDFGCGSGVLSIAATRLGAREVLGIDCDPSAICVARENVELNKVAGTVALRTMDTLPTLEAPWDFIVANINPVVVAEEAEHAAELLAPDGIYVCTGIPIEREVAMLEVLREAGFGGITPRPSGEWIGFLCTAPRGED